MGIRVKGSGLVLVGLQHEPGIPQLLTWASQAFPAHTLCCLESVLQHQRYDEMFCFITCLSLLFEWLQFSDNRGANY